MADGNDMPVSTGQGGAGRKVLVGLAGLALGSLSAVGIQYSVGAMVPAKIIAEREAAPKPVEYVSIDNFTLPLVDKDGDLISYLKVGVSLEVPEGAAADMKDKLPIVMHEVNMATWDAGLSRGKDGRLFDASAVEKIFMGAAKDVYGNDLVKRVLLISAIPS